MYKIQMALQKIACYLAVISGAVSFVYSLGISTDLYDNMKFIEEYSLGIPGPDVYYGMHDFNKMFMNLSIVLLLLCCLLFLTQTHARRRYYIGNYAATGIVAAANLAMTAWTHGQIEACKAAYLALDLASIQEWAEMMDEKFSITTTMFDLHYAVAALLVLAAVVLLTVMTKKEE